MTNKGRHASQTPGTFYRDLAIMILGILVVGAGVFFLLYIFADNPATGPTTTVEAANTTTTEVGSTTTVVEESTTTSTTEPPSTTVPIRSPEEVSVLVLNSMGLDGAASRMTNNLEAEGYQTLTPGNYNPEQDPSRVWYREGYAAEATNLLPFIPGATVEPLPDEAIGEGANVVIVLGTGYEE